MTPDPSSPDHLTEVLRRAGVLGSAHVSGVAVEKSGPTILSQIAHLRLSYQGPVHGAPRSIILKTDPPDRRGQRWYSGSQEVAFYTGVAPLMTQQLVPRCFEAEADPETQSWHLLLEDLTDTHVIATRWPLPP